MIKQIFSAVTALAMTGILMTSVGAVQAEEPSALSKEEIEALMPQIEAADNLLIHEENCYSSTIATSELAEKTGSEYGYTHMENRENTENRERLYNELMSCMESVWTSETDSMQMDNVLVGTFYIMEVLVLEDFGLNFDEASEVYEMFRHDNPIFYFASNAVYGYSLSDTQTILMVCCFEEFAPAAVKQECNAMIEPYIMEYAGCVGSGSTFTDAKAIHDKLILSMDYAYQEDGVTPSETGYAHSIMGAIVGEGTCDAYAKTYQMLCEYYGIESIFVTGYVHDNHAWNLLQMDDGNYYFVDCTGDDLGDAASDAFFAVGTDTLYQTHTINTPENIGADYLYALPDISKTDYNAAEIPEDKPTAGDVDRDGQLSTADLVLLQKWLLAADVEISSENADLCPDGVIDIFDLGMMKHILLTGTV